jgi:hypothetical protein
MRLTVTFSDEADAVNAKEIMQAAQNYIFNNTDEECFLGDYISNEGLSEGITFDSYWVPSGSIDTKGGALMFELVGSPGDDLPGDVILWLGRLGAKNAKGSLVISVTGDVIDIDHSF